MNRSALLLTSIVALVAGCDTAPKTDQGRAALTSDAKGTVASFIATDPTLNELVNQSRGYAVFPDVGKAGFIAGGAYGRGEVYDRGMLVGYADLAQGTVGLQIGVQNYDELILFLTDEQMAKFRANQFAISANLSAVAITSGAAAAADHSKGVIVFVRSRGGLMAEASIGGQQFTFKPLGENRGGVDASMDSRRANGPGTDQ